MNILVLGAGKSGLSAAFLGNRRKHDVILFDSNPNKFSEDLISELISKNIKYIYGNENLNKIDDVDIIVASPGIPPNSEVITYFDNKNIEIVSEIEFAFRFIDNKPEKIVSITGTNGKTTTANLLYHILNYNKKEVMLAGNVGTPLSDIVDSLKGKYLVLELSSYQLDRIKKFNSDIGVFLNISEDHLDYHGSFEHYLNAKWKISINMDDNNLLVLNKDDELIISSLNKRLSVLGGDSSIPKPEVNFFSIKESIDKPHSIYCVNNEVIYVNETHKEVIMSRNDIPLYGDHNLSNTLAATLAAKYLQIRNEDIRDAVASFHGVEHRLELVSDADNIRIINDSKATNVNSAWYALNSFQDNIIWIAGGMNSNNDYSQLDDIVSKKVETIICFGDEKNRIFNHFSSITNCIVVNDITEAVETSASLLKTNYTLLFSPSCKSFDSFINFEHRGQVFKDLVHSTFKNDG